MEFRVGDRVKPKLGTVEMKVEEVYPRIYLYRYRCRWTDDDGEVRHEVFRFEQLIPIAESGR